MGIVGLVVGMHLSGAFKSTPVRMALIMGVGLGRVVREVR
jgi:hypothetical protein